MADQPLSRRIALVTGANHGIGAATAVELARLGADVAITHLPMHNQDDDPTLPSTYSAQRQQSGAATVAAVEAAGSRCLSRDADLRDPEVPTHLFDEIEHALGRVSILVNNASAWRKDTFIPNEPDHLGCRAEPVGPATVDAQLSVDARASALLISELATRHRARRAAWGRIVGLTSGGPMGFPGEVSYGAAKAALENFTMAAAVELADDGITANIVHPPVTDTGWVTDEVRDFVTGSPEHTNVADPAEVAEVIGWLCTDAARLVSGNIIRLR